ncbi:MAG: ABC transporter permease [Chloroflexi bacterium]|nr:ABC transporter permease [Chloroflexota bacterium]
MRLSLLKTALRDQLRRPWLLLLMILSVALGVAVVVSVDLANQSATRAFKLSADAVVGKATHQIVGGVNGIDESVYRVLRVQHGYRLSAPVVEGYARALELGRQTQRVLGVDLFAETPFRTYFSSSTQVPLESFAAFLTQPGAVLISADTAQRFNLQTGDRMTLVVESRQHVVTIAGLLKPPNDVSARALEGLMLADIATAQELFAMTGRLSRIDLIATPQQAQQIAAALPADLRLVPASEQANTVTQLTAAFQLNLTAFSLLALVVGMFLIYNTTLFAVVQRRRILGILRCLGVTGREIFVLILLESAIGATIGSLLGLGLGILLGRLTVGLVTQTINDLYFSVTVRGVDVDPLTLVKGMLLGIAAALLAAALPAAEAASVPAVTVLQRSDLELRVRRWLPGVTRVGCLLVLTGAALLAFIDDVAVSFTGILLGLFGVTLAVPILTIAFMRLATATLGRLGLLGRMAARTVTQALSRTSVAIAALMVAVSVVIGVTVMIASFRATVANWLDQTLTADIYISAPSVSANRASTLDPALAERIRAIPGIASTETLRSASVYSPDLGAVRLNAITAIRRRDPKLYRFATGDPNAIWQMVQGGAVVVSEPFANRHHVQPGSAITLDTDHGPQTFPVVGVYYDYSSDQGFVMMDLNVYRRYWNDPEISGVSVYVAPGANVNQVEDALRAALAGRDVLVQSHKALRDAALVIFDRTFAITTTLRLIAIVVAFIGILGALMALQLERTRELGTLRAAGMTLEQLWRLTLLESGLMGATAGLLSIPSGFILAAILIYVINLRSFGWTIFFQAEPQVYAEAFALAVVAALLAAVYPMLRLSRLQAAEALREE